ncbi:MAG: diaminopimelate epimerase [Bacteroidales bacterium]|nr:diaminopimelate epimerase [Bacteroidales bacterium]
MKLAFSKYHGTGNDFILIDNRGGNIRLTRDQIALLCDRHLGIGADGLMFLNTREGYDFGMSYYNSDGNESTLCGNGGRCITAFARSLDLIKFNARFTAIDGEHTAEIINKIGEITSIRLKMSDIDKSKIQELKSKIQNPKSKIIYHTSSLVPRPSSFVINTGSPHCLIFMEDTSAIDVGQEGRKIRYDTVFEPEGTNVDFVQILENNHLFVRTYERGVEDETLSCGTGVTAAALAYAIIKLQAMRHEAHGIDHQASGIRYPASRIGVEIPGTRDSIRIETRGGLLTVTFRHEADRFTDIWLEGPAEFVFKGEIEVNRETKDVRRKM